ncbi:MAG: beta-propeller fold lactonase family protein [Bacteroidales bacterium]
MKKSVLFTLIAIIAISFISMLLPKGDKVNEKKGILVVANKSGDNISLIERETGKTLKTLPTGLQPHEVEISGDGKYAVVSNYGDKENPGNSLSVYNIEQAKLIKTIDLGENTRPHGMKWIEGTNKLLATTEGSNSLLVVNIENGNIEKKMNTEQEISHMVAATPDGKYAFVSSIRTGNVTAFNLETGELLKQMHSGEGAEGIAVSPGGNELWVTNRGENSIAVFDVNTLERIQKIDCGDFPIRAKFSPSGKHFVVSNAESGEIAVFNTKKKKLISKIKLTPPVPEDKDPERYFSEFEGSSVPIGLVVPDDNTVYVANTRSDVVSVFDLTKMEIIGHFEAGKEPDGINYSPINPGN